MAITVEQLRESIGRLQLMSSRDLEAMRSRWFRPGREDVDDPAKFRQWLITNHFLTPFAIGVLSAGKGEQLVLNQYRVRDQIKAGPLAGAYLASDPLQRPVVVQVVSRAVTDDPASRDLLQKIVQHAIKLQHPNVCRALEYGQAQGLHYLVREYDEAATLADILQRRNKLPHDQAAKIFALACEGLRALHEHGVPGGVLTADCVLLATTGKGGSRAQRTVRLLVAAARKDIFDARAIGGTPDEAKARIPDDFQLMPLTEEKGGIRPTQPPEDILRLGCLFYRCLTGKDPFPPDLLPQPSHRAAPIAESAPEVPEALAEIVEGTIDPDPEKRPRSAGHVAKALRVFLRAEEEGREVREEEQVVIPKKLDPQQAAAEQDEVIEAEVEEDEEEAPRRAARPRPAEPALGVAGKIREVWEELRPEPREWLYIGIGAALMIILILLLELFSGIRFVHLVLLATGAALSFVVERLLLWWESRKAGAGERGGA